MKSIEKEISNGYLVFYLFTLSYMYALPPNGITGYINRGTGSSISLYVLGDT